jgi:hemoglobin
MKKDISNRGDIEKVVMHFYEKVKADDRIGFYFSEVIPINWEKHIPLMCSFWENVLFYTGNYEGNPLVTHQRINALYGTSTPHFERWLQLFDESIDDLFQGGNSEKMKAHAKAIAAVMQEKL